MEYSLSSSERLILPVCYRVPHRFQVEVAKEIYWERKFSKKQRWRQFLSPRASKTTEWQHGDSWDTVCSSPNTYMTKRCCLNGVIIDITRYFTYFSMLNEFYFMHESRGNAHCRVFGCPRMKRGAPDLRVIQAGWLRCWSCWPRKRSV